MKIILPILSLLFVSTCFGQLVILDSVSNNPIPAVNVFDSKGQLLSISDKNGKIDIQIDELSPSDFITLQHISYHPKEVKTSDLQSSETKLLLSPANIFIDEILVNNKPKDWLVLRGYFRMLETFDKKNRTYADGIIRFYVPLNGKRNKKDHIIEKHRIFKDHKATEEIQEKMGWVYIFPTISNIDPRPLHLNLEKKHQVKNEGSKTNIYKNNSKVGEIQFSPSGIAQTYVDFVQPDSIKKRKLFRIEVILKSLVRIETYDASNLSEITIDRLQSWYGNIVGSIKRKKEHGHLPYEILNEFYVIDRYYLTNEDINEEKKLFRKTTTLPDKSSYSDEFWKGLEEFEIPEIPVGVGRQLGRELKEI